MLRSGHRALIWVVRSVISEMGDEALERGKIVRICHSSSECRRQRMHERIFMMSSWMRD